jgi:cytochrome c-type biogenesis protein CcmE
VNTDTTTPTARRPRLGRLAIGIALVASALGYLVYAGTKDNLVYYYEVDEVQAAAAKTGGKIRISGDVVEGSIIRDEEAREIRSIRRSTMGQTAADEEPSRRPARPSGRIRCTVPDIFREGIQVVVKVRWERRQFEAETLLAKCPLDQEAGQLSSDPAPSPRS